MKLYYLSKKIFVFAYLFNIPCNTVQRFSFAIHSQSLFFLKFSRCGYRQACVDKQTCGYVVKKLVCQRVVLIPVPLHKAFWAVLTDENWKITRSTLYDACVTVVSSSYSCE